MASKMPARTPKTSIYFNYDVTEKECYAICPRADPVLLIRGVLFWGEVLGGSPHLNFVENQRNNYGPKRHYICLNGAQAHYLQNFQYSSAPILPFPVNTRGIYKIYSHNMYKVPCRYTSHY